ncbi:hypothetical protein D9M71_571520 [compost metagenome]
MYWRSWVISCSTSTMPLTWPSLTIGEPTRLIDTVLPSRRWISRACSEPPLRLPLSTCSTKLRPSSSACSSTRLNSADSGRPWACPDCQWVNCSAAGFM